ncbi:MAG TPA: hypothetical protein H9670_06425, partial [Firmicutes bacterium]|nr:hypothetical protein [Bacillota bacterium]
RTALFIASDPVIVALTCREEPTENFHIFSPVFREEPIVKRIIQCRLDFVKDSLRKERRDRRGRGNFSAAENAKYSFFAAWVRKPLYFFSENGIMSKSYTQVTCFSGREIC